MLSSQYKSKFSQGANLFPRSLIFFEIEEKRSGTLIITADLEVLSRSKKKWKYRFQRKEIENDLEFLKTVRSDDFSLREPNLTFHEGCVIYGKDNSVQMRTFNKAHTDGDVIVYIPEEKVLFAGDLLFARRDPWLGSGDPEGWISVNDELTTIDFKVSVPGHGNLATKEEFALQNKYIKELIELVKKRIDAGEDPTQINRDDFSKELKSWKSPVLEWNVNFLAEFLKKS